MTTDSRIRVLIVDDSLVAREMLTQILSSDPGIEVIGEAKNGLEAIAKVAELRPDLVTMDIHMPRCDGLKATEQIMAYTPTPILVVSSSVYGEGMGRAFDALEMGALEVLKKPEPRDWAHLENIGREVIRKVKILARVKVITHIRGRRTELHPTSPIEISPKAERGGVSLVAIGSSTGGPSALLSILGRLPKELPVPIVIAQHIAEGFIPGLVSWLNAGCKIDVREARDGQNVEAGAAFIAPTGTNLSMDGLTMRFTNPLSGQLYVPSADTLFESVATSIGRNSLGVILTGMGADGAKGLKLLHDTGAATIAQDESTSTVWGMPKAAVELGAARVVLPIHDIAEKMIELIAESNGSAI
ncbi:MAG: chemotaxis-specific protein-glutamate methyltransferase CheB [Actinobacteria bacterium]|nr:chemotaxis-specific protein-glutamate methyltransferase CheB [Actinomycetota bacterium]